MKIVLAIALVLGSVTHVHADDGDNTKNPAAAFGMSFGGTLASGALIALSYDLHSGGEPNNALLYAGVAGLALMPSAGHWYAHDYVSMGLLIRAGGVAGAALLFAASPCVRGDSPYEACTNISGGQQVALIGGAASFLIGTLWDIGTAPGAASRYNEKLQISLVPVVSRGSYGLALGGRF